MYIYTIPDSLASNVRSYVRYPDTPSCRTRITIAAIRSIPIRLDMA
jgi:hypothetical protein